MSDSETDLRQRIKEGSNDLDDYIDLVDLLFKSYRKEETLTILQKASLLDLTPAERGILLNEQAQYACLIAGPSEEVLVLAEKALSTLGEQPRSPEVALSEADAARLVAELIWDTDRLRPFKSRREHCRQSTT